MIKFALAFEKWRFDSVAQLVEHYTFNVVVLGSNPSGITSNFKPFQIGEAFFITYVLRLYTSSYYF
jgi:hypothetical protein